MHTVATFKTIGEAGIVAWSFHALGCLVAPHFLVAIARAVAWVVLGEESVVGCHLWILLNLVHRVDVLEHGVAGALDVAKECVLDVEL